MNSDNQSLAYSAEDDGSQKLSIRPGVVRFRIIAAAVMDLLMLAGLGILAPKFPIGLVQVPLVEATYISSNAVAVAALCVVAYMTFRVNSAIVGDYLERKVVTQSLRVIRYCFWFTLFCCLVAVFVSIVQESSPASPLPAPDLAGGTMLLLADLLILFENYLTLRKLLRRGGV
jgi:hypothetical protein